MQELAAHPGEYETRRSPELLLCGQQPREPGPLSGTGRRQGSAGRVRWPVVRFGLESDHQYRHLERNGLGRQMREVRAFLLAPVPAAILGAIVYKASGDFTRLLWVAIGYVWLLYAVQLLFGLAVRAFLLRTGRRAAFHFAIGGTVMTGIPSLPFLAWDVAQNSISYRTPWPCWSYG